MEPRSVLLCLSPIGLSLVAKLAPKRFASLLMGVWFLGNAGGYVLTGVLGALLPPSPDKYIAMQKEDVDLKAILEGQKEASGRDLYILGTEKIGVAIDVKKAKENNIDLNKAFEKSAALLKKARDRKDTAYTLRLTLDSVLTKDQFETIKSQALVKPAYPVFMGFKLKDVYDFFMLFVILCGLAGLVLYALTPMMKKMMHGVR
jgi:proton-dependent oligopeptide transporter, POT family